MKDEPLGDAEIVALAEAWAESKAKFSRAMRTLDAAKAIDRGIMAADAAVDAASRAIGVAEHVLLHAVTKRIAARNATRAA